MRKAYPKGGKVRLLDPHTVNQIAAGEVVERPAAALKELLENAIDAGATKIVAEIRSAGKGLIRVSDNGFGMTEEEGRLALMRHATSKISKVEDLMGVQSLGFRGEALPSIASVSRLTLRSRSDAVGEEITPYDSPVDQYSIETIGSSPDEEERIAAQAILPQESFLQENFLKGILPTGSEPLANDLMEISPGTFGFALRESTAPFGLDLESPGLQERPELTKALVTEFESPKFPPESEQPRNPSTETRFGLRVEGGKIESLTPVAGAVGTEILVEDLFYNTPARLKFLKSESTELGACMDVAGRLAFSHPWVSIRLIHNGREAFESPGDGNLREALASVWSRDLVRGLVEVDAEVAGVKVKGFTSPPHLTKPTRAYQFLFVNGRAVRSRSLTVALDQAYRDLTPERRYPVVALLLEVDPSKIDVNVSPTKSEVKFQQEGAAFEALRVSLRGALMAHGMMPSASAIATANQAMQIALDQGHSPSYPGHPSFPGDLTIGSDQNLSSFPESASVHHISVFERSRHGEGLTVPSHLSGESTSEGFFPWNLADRDDRSDHIQNQTPSVGSEIEPINIAGISSEPASSFISNPNPSDVVPSGPPSDGFQPQMDARYPFGELLQGLRVIGQAMNTFIIAETKRGLAIIDQHVAHERVLYEWLCGLKGPAGVAQQPLLVPLTLNLDRRAALLLREKLDDVSRAGFSIEPFGGESFLVRSAPAALRGKDPLKTLRSLAEELVEGSVARKYAPTCEQVWAMASCKMAVKAGDPLGMAEMQKLVEDLAETENPYLCPHGRPITVTLDGHGLLKLFKRI